MRLVSLGDSFTEGVGDELPDGRLRGWADLLAIGLAVDRGIPIDYANLAIRGRLIGPIVAEQLEPALALGPTMLTFNGGGNDILRPRADIDHVSALTEHVITRCLDSGVRPVVLSGGNPTRNLPLGKRMQQKGDRLTSAVKELTTKYNVTFVNVWGDTQLTHASYWGEDRLHLNATGHHRVAALVLQTLGVPHPAEWTSHAPQVTSRPGLAANIAFYRRYVMPWIHRRLTGRSSGDGRQPKYVQWRSVEPSTLY